MGGAALKVGVAYVAALLAAAGAAAWLGELHPLWIVLGADVVATIVVFAFSAVYRNASFYDPYWSVAPPLIAAYFAVVASPTPRLLVALALLTFWSARLTYNWWRRWEGLSHEDWRYVDLRARTGRAFGLVSFLGIHLFPTLIVYLGCLPLWAMAVGDEPLGVLDAVAASITAGAIAIEAIADEQLRAHATSERRGQLLDRGLWALSRHPNYFGELALWWGVMLFAVAAGAREWWIFSGAAAMTALFLFISIPLVEERALARRGDAYRAYASRTSMLIPWPPRSSSHRIDR